jgi:hypothetical protein
VGNTKMSLIFKHSPIFQINANLNYGTPDYQCHWPQFKNSYLFVNIVMIITRCVNTMRPFPPTSFIAALLKQFSKRILHLVKFYKNILMIPEPQIKQGILMMQMNPLLVLQNNHPLMELGIFQ